MFLSERTRATIWFKAGGLCGLCGEPVDPRAMHLDHIVPLASGGSDAASNLRPTHAACNLRRKPARINRYRKFVLVLPVESVDGMLECAYREDLQLTVWMERTLNDYVEARRRHWIEPGRRRPVPA